MSIVAQTQSIMSKADKRFRSVKHKVLEVKQEIDKTENFIRENINTVENFIIPSIEALEGTLSELESSKQEIDMNLEEVSQAIQELEDKIQEVYSEQNDKLNPEIIATLNGQVSLEDCEKELENMHNKIKAFEEEIKRKCQESNKNLENEVQKKLNYKDNERRKAELDKLELELKSKIDKLNSIKKDEQIQMLEKANELDSIREEMEKALAEFESIKNKKMKAKESLK